MAIRAHLPLDERLSVLRATDDFRDWGSLDEKRVCVVCGKTFSGCQVGIRRGRGGHFHLQCPTEDCHSGPNRWVYPGNPLVSDGAYQDWWRALRDGEEKSITTTPIMSSKQRYA